MKKYFKPLDWKILIPITGIISWTLLFTLFSNQEHIFPKWVEIPCFIMCWLGLSIYVKWERIKINFDWILNIIYCKKLLELNYQYKQQFFYLDIHKEQYFDDYGDLNIVNTKLFQSYQISRVCTKYVNNQIHFCIELKRPGYLIGKRGSNLEEIQKLLNCKIHIVECKDIWFNKQNNIF